MYNIYNSDYENLEELKHKKNELDDEYNKILSKIKGTNKKDEIEFYQSKLIFLLEKYNELAEKLKKK